MIIGVPKEVTTGERRVALVPDVVRGLSARGLEVLVEQGAGIGAGIADALFVDAGGSIAADPRYVYGADIVVKVRAPSAAEIPHLRADGALIGFLEPLTNPRIGAIAGTGVTSFAFEAIPRGSREQALDALSSQAGVAGYWAALAGALALERFLPMLTTAAGTIPPAKVLVLGCGVAGLQAIATARRLGAAVQGFDVRAAAREEVESLGARFLELDLGADLQAAGGYARPLTMAQQTRQHQLIADAVSRVDLVITSGAVPGRAAPVLLTGEAVAQMMPGSVIVDLAAVAGGNCELTEPGETVVRHGVKILGPVNPSSAMSGPASAMLARNVEALLGLVIDGSGQLAIDLDDRIVAAACITHRGLIVHEGARNAAQG